MTKKLSGPDVPRRMRGSLEWRYWLKVDKRGPGECWDWKASTRNGYGVIGMPGRKIAYAHRLALQFSGLDIPDGKCALHHCDNRLCVNPAHLYVGTKADNIADAYKRNARMRIRPSGDEWRRARGVTS